MNATWVTCFAGTGSRNKQKQCDSCLSRGAAHVVINALQAISQEAHVGGLLLELSNVRLSLPLQLRRVAQQILARASGVLAFDPGSLLLLEGIDQAGIDEIGFLQRGRMPRLELGAGGLRERARNRGKFAFDQASKRRGAPLAGVARSPPAPPPRLVELENDAWCADGR